MIVLASDYDGTLKRQGKISETDIMAIQNFQREGNLFSLITGRSISMIRSELQKYGIPFDYLICGNGAIVADKNYNILKRQDIDYNIAINIIELLKNEAGVSFGISDGDRFGACQVDNNAVDMSDEMFDDISDYESILSEKNITMILVQHENEELTLKLKGKLEKRFGESVAFHFNKGALNISSALVDKKNGVEMLQKQLNCTIYTIGDGYNDISMIQSFNGFSVKNAPEDVKKEASKVFDSVKDCIEYLKKKNDNFKKEYDLFFFDVDGTLLDNKTHSIPESSLMALKKLKEAGKRIIICSGRSYSGVMEMEEIRRIKWDGFVLLNGAVAADKNGKELFRHQMSKELIRKLIDLSDKKGIVLSCLGEKEWLNKKPDEYTRKAYDFFHRDADSFEVYPLKEKMKVSMALAFESEESDYSDFKAIQELYVLPTRHCYADINDAKINKSVGMKELCKAMNTDLSNTMAFGDGINDLEMILEAGMGIAMGQGVEKIKQAADYITDPVDQDGIWNALVHFNIIE